MLYISSILIMGNLQGLSQKSFSHENEALSDHTPLLSLPISYSLLCVLLVYLALDSLHHTWTPRSEVQACHHLGGGPGRQESPFYR